MTAKIEFATTIINMLLTTAEVVASPTEADPPLTWNPLRQPIQVIIIAKTPLFRKPQKMSKR
jgi:hypothetical protein